MVFVVVVWLSTNGEGGNDETGRQGVKRLLDQIALSEDGDHFDFDFFFHVSCCDFLLLLAGGKTRSTAVQGGVNDYLAILLITKSTFRGSCSANAKLRTNPNIVCAWGQRRLFELHRQLSSNYPATAMQPAVWPTAMPM